MKINLDDFRNVQRALRAKAEKKRMMRFIDKCNEEVKMAGAALLPLARMKQSKLKALE